MPVAGSIQGGALPVHNPGMQGLEVQLLSLSLSERTSKDKTTANADIDAIREGLLFNFTHSIDRPNRR